MRLERGTATVEFVGLIPFLLIVCLVATQLIAAGYSLWSASVAARAGARAAHIGGDPRAAARSALPQPMRAGSEVRWGEGRVTTRVPVPRVMPLFPSLKIEAKSTLEAR